MTRCMIKGCGLEKSQILSSKIKLHRFPKNKINRDAWLLSLGLDKPPQRTSVICSVHFEEKYRANQRLTSSAIPTLYLGNFHNGQSPAVDTTTLAKQVIRNAIVSHNQTPEDNITDFDTDTVSYQNRGTIYTELDSSISTNALITTEEIKQEVDEHFIKTEIKLENNETDNFIEEQNIEMENDNFAFDPTIVKEEIQITDYINDNLAEKSYLQEQRETTDIFSPTNSIANKMSQESIDNTVKHKELTSPNVSHTKIYDKDTPSNSELNTCLISPKKASRITWDQHDLWNALRAIQTGMKVASASTLFCIPLKTLYKYRKIFNIKLQGNKLNRLEDLDNLFTKSIRESDSSNFSEYYDSTDSETSYQDSDVLTYQKHSENYTRISKDQKELSIKNSKKGYTIEDASSITNMNINSAESNLGAYNSNNNQLVNHLNDGSHRRKLTQEIVSVIETCVELESHPGYKLKRIQKILAEEYHINMSISSIYRGLIKLKITIKLPSIEFAPFFNAPGPIALRKKYANEFSPWLHVKHPKTIFIEDCVYSLHTRSKQINKCKGSAVNHDKLFSTQYLTLISAISDTEIVHSKVLFLKTSTPHLSIFCIFLKELHKKMMNNPNLSGACLVMNNDRNTTKIISLVESFNLPIRFLPPYSPMLNPIVKAFLKIKAYARRTFADPSVNHSLKDVIKNAVSEITASDCSNYFKDMMMEISAVLQ